MSASIELVAVAKPVRIHRQRVKGWRMPENTAYVGRGSLWGNPYAYRTRAGLARVPALDGSPWEYEGRISADGMQHDYFHPDGTMTRHTVRYMTRAEVVEMYRRALLEPTQDLCLGYRSGQDWIRITPKLVRASLAGLNLACWCAPSSVCHADVLLKVAAGELP